MKKLTALWNPAWAFWIVIASAVMFVVSLAALPLVLVHLPEDYFLRMEHVALRRYAHPVVHVIWVVARNVLGAILVLAGAVMLVTPGQGVLTILVGLMFLDLPGKRELILRLVRQPKVLTAINGLRRRFDKPPLKTSTPE